MFRELPVEPAMLFADRRELAAQALRITALRGVPHPVQRSPRGVVEPLSHVPVQRVERVADSCFVVARLLIAASRVFHWTPPQNLQARGPILSQDFDSRARGGAPMVPPRGVPHGWKTSTRGLHGDRLAHSLLSA